MKNNKVEETDIWIVWTSIIVGVLIIGAWLLTIYLLKDKEDRGVFGDMFGSVNALFSGLALAGIIITILLQRNELKLQREELRYTRREFELQNDTLRKQQFEASFFPLLTIQRDITQNISAEIPFVVQEINYTILSLDVFDFGNELKVFKSYNLLKVFFELIEYHKNEYSNSDSYLQKFKNYYDKYISSNLNHYFRHMYSMIRYIDNSQNIDKNRYIQIFESQLSNDELIIIFLHSISFANSKDRNLLFGYRFFQNMVTDNSFLNTLVLENTPNSST